jgi:flavin-dependent dehydrogenase
VICAQQPCGNLGRKHKSTAEKTIERTLLKPTDREVEVLVVGASLAGLCAAEVASHNGARTLLIDAAPEIGGRPNPANILMEPTWRRTELPIPEEAVRRRLLGLRVSGPSGSGPLFRLRAVHLDRRIFDRSFAKRAIEAGAAIQSGVRVTGLLPSGGVTTDSGFLRASITIFADGARSAVRRLLPTMRTPQDIAFGLDRLLKAPNLGTSPYFEVRFGSFAPGWRAQLNPLGGDRASLWTFVRGVGQEDLERYAEQAQRAFLGGNKAQILEERRGVDPAFVVPGQIAGDGVLAVGAAAGQGGLEYGARAGRLAGEAAAKALRDGDTSRRALKAYESAWLRETAMQLRVLRWGMEALRRLSDTALDATFNTVSELEFDEEEFVAFLGGDPRSMLRKVGLGSAVKIFLGLVRGWIGTGA